MAWMPFLQFYPLFVASRPSDVFGDGMKNPQGGPIVSLRHPYSPFRLGPTTAR